MGTNAPALANLGDYTTDEPHCPDSEGGPHYLLLPTDKITALGVNDVGVSQTVCSLSILKYSCTWDDPSS